MVVVSDDLAVEHVSSVTDVVLECSDIDAGADIIYYYVSYALGQCLVLHNASVVVICCRFGVCVYIRCAVRMEAMFPRLIAIYLIPLLLVLIILICRRRILTKKIRGRLLLLIIMIPRLCIHRLTTHRNLHWM